MSGSVRKNIDMQIDRQKAGWGDRGRLAHKVYLEDCLWKGACHQAAKLGLRTGSRYLRRAVVYMLKSDGYPLDEVTGKFKKVRALQRAVS